MNSPYQILLYYKYTHVADPAGFVQWHKNICEKLGFKGRILIAHEGINGTLEGLRENTEKYIELMRAQDGSEGTYGDFRDMPFKTSSGSVDGTAFPKMKVKFRKEVVSLGLDRYGEEDVNPNEVTGAYLEPEDLKKWYEQGEDFEIIDMRNDYEFKVGHFKNSVNPEMENFRDLPKVLPKLESLKKASEEGKKILTVCTGGIRCEKASGYIIKKGFKNVYQLHGGMHKFMEKYPGEEFLGSLYVFDDREVVDFMDKKPQGQKVIVGTCETCSTQTEIFTNCANIECHKKMLCCDACLKRSVADAKELAQSLVALGDEESVKTATSISNILEVAGGFIFCSEECKNKVGAGKGVVAQK